MKMREQSKWRNRFCGGQSEVLLEKMRNEGWGGGGGGGGAGEVNNFI